VLAALGPLAGLAHNAFRDLEETLRPAVWAVTELPLATVPPGVNEAVARGQTLYVLEEHIKQGGLGMQLVYALASTGVCPRRTVHRHALGYPSGRYGSQAFHRRECGLDTDAIRALIGAGEV
jgi:transketolase